MTVVPFNGCPTWRRVGTTFPFPADHGAVPRISSLLSFNQSKTPNKKQSSAPPGSDWRSPAAWTRKAVPTDFELFAESPLRRHRRRRAPCSAGHWNKARLLKLARLSLAGCLVPASMMEKAPWTTSGWSRCPPSSIPHHQAEKPG